MTDAAALRALIAAAADLEPELAAWLGACVWAGLPPARRRRIRDELLREAARLVPDASVWQRARLLADLSRRPGSPGVSTAAGLVSLAAAIYSPDPRDPGLSVSQVFRVLVSRISPVEMEAGAVADWNPVQDLFREDDND